MAIHAFQRYLTPKRAGTHNTSGRTCACAVQQSVRGQISSRPDMSQAWFRRQRWCGIWKQPTAPRQPVVVYIEGNIGIGKSTLLKGLEEKGFPVVQEPVDLWTNFHGINFLDLYSKNMEKWAFTFQSLVLFTLWQTQVEVLQGSAPVVVAERSLSSVMRMFVQTQLENKFITSEQFILLEEMSKTMSAQLNRQEYYIYLRGSSTTAFQRLQSRARAEETTLSKGYLQQLHTVLDTWMDNEPKLHAVVDASGTPETIQQQVLRALSQL